MSRQNSHDRINQSGAKIGIGSVENLNADQICGSRKNFQPIPKWQVVDTKSGRPNNPPNPRQIYWEEVLKNHRRLIKTYWHILKLTD